MTKISGSISEELLWAEFELITQLVQFKTKPTVTVWHQWGIRPKILLLFPFRLLFSVIHQRGIFCSVLLTK